MSKLTDEQLASISKAAEHAKGALACHVEAAAITASVLELLDRVQSTGEMSRADKASLNGWIADDSEAKAKAALRRAWDAAHREVLN